MTNEFNLLRERWIPVALENGRRVLIRPCEISEPFDGQNILRIASGRPDCDISLTEFLIGLLAVTMAPQELRAWPKLYRTPPSREELETAFLPLGVAMNLDGEGPRFFQDLEQLEGEATPIEALFMDAPAQHFTKPGRIKALSRTGAAIALATLQTSAPAGGAGHRTSLRGGGPLTTLVLPGTPGNAEPTLWQRLWANVPCEMRAEPGDYPRVFPWLVPTRVSDGGRATTPEDVHSAQAFFGLPRRIRLNFEDNTDRRPCDLLGIVDDKIVTSYITRPRGTNYTGWSRGHPLSPYYRPKPSDIELLPLHLKSSRVGYRQYLGMVVGTRDDLPAQSVLDFPTRAQNLEGAEKAALLNSRLLAAGYAMDNMKPLDFGEALMPLIVTGDPRSDELVRLFAERFIRAAELTANELVKAIKRGLYGERSDAQKDSTILDAARNRFWSDTEEPFYKGLRAAAKQLFAKREALADVMGTIEREAGQSWRFELRKHSLSIFDETVPIEDAESNKIKDVIEGRKMLVLALEGYGPRGRKIFSELQLPLPDSRSARGRSAA